MKTVCSGRWARNERASLLSTKLFLTRGAGGSIKPGVKRSGTPGIATRKLHEPPIAGDRVWASSVLKIRMIPTNLLSPVPPAGN
jgi:hypothetical protein